MSDTLTQSRAWAVAKIDATMPGLSTESARDLLCLLRRWVDYSFDECEAICTYAAEQNPNAARTLLIRGIERAFDEGEKNER